MQNTTAVIERAVAAGSKTLSEHDSKTVLAAYGIPVTRESLAEDWAGVQTAAAEIGYPVVLKACGADIAHKTEANLIALDVPDEARLKESFERLQQGTGDLDAAFLVQEMVQGKREFVAGMIRDPGFGPCVMFGLGGIFTEVLRDVSFRVAPLERRDALEMMDEIEASGILGNFRGMEAVDRDAMADILVALGVIGIEQEAVREIDVNPLIIAGSSPVAVDALFVLE